MRTHKIIFLCLSFSASLVYAKSDSHFATIIGGGGTILFNSKKVTVGTHLNDKGVLETKKGASAKVLFDKSQSVVSILPESSLELDRPEALDKRPYEHRYGMVRWKISKLKLKKNAIFVRSKNATLGVRGTEFITIVNPILGETEIVVMDGKVSFGNRKDSSDETIVKKNQWGGLGGRFGDKIGKILNLPKNVIQHFDQVTQVETSK